jgi:hypothetical protein
MIDTTKRNKFLKKNQERTVTPVELLASEDRSANLRRIMRYQQMWDAMHDFRIRRKRNKQYFNGDQWKDLVEVEKGKYISEEQNIISQGKVPLKKNMIGSTVTSILGVFRNTYGKPEVIARSTDNQKLGEMNTCLAEYVYQHARVKEIDAKDMLEAMISGMCLQIVDYHYDNVTMRNETQVNSINPSRVFLNGGIEDPRGGDISTIGVLLDMTIDEVVAKFARSNSDAIKIRGIYKTINKEYITNLYRTFSESSVRDITFMEAPSMNLCRVIQAWEYQYDDVLLVHDYLNGTWEEYPLGDSAAIDAMIQQREIEIDINGWDYDKAKIEKKYHHDEYWYVRYLSPCGDVLYEGRSPFNHKSHPFAIYLGHLIDGEIHSFVENIIDQQRYINRLITLIDFIMGSSAKGVLVFPEYAIPAGMNKDDILEQWTSYRGVIFANLKPGTQMPQQISTNATNIGANEMLALQMQLIRDISGVHGALQGKEAKSGTAASLYAQEANNAQVNIADLLESFTEFRQARDYKLVKIAPQCYDTPFFVSLAGNDYSKEAHYWNPEAAASADVYVNLSENNNTAVYRMQANQIVIKAMEMGLIDFETVLQTGVMPNGDKLLSVIKRRKEELQKEQLQAQAAMMQGQAMGTQMQESGASEGEVLQAGADISQQILADANAQEANPRAMELINQALM